MWYTVIVVISKTIKKICCMKTLFRFLPTSFRRGSVLAYTLILLSVVLLAAIGIATVSVTNERGALLSNRSVSSFQVADTGSQAAIAEIRNTLSSGGAQLSDLTVAGGSCSNAGGFATISSSNSGTVGDYTLTFYDKDENQLKCSDNLSQIATVKSVGVYRDTSRAVKVAVAAGTCPVTGGMVIVDESSNENGFSMSTVNNFVNSEKGRIVAATCTTSTRVSSFSGEYGIISTQFLVGSTDTDSAAAIFRCYTSDNRCFIGGIASPAQCTSGWKIYGECPVL